MQGLKDIRKKSGMRLEDMAVVLGVSMPTASRIEREPWEMKMSQYANLYRALGTDSRRMLRELLEETVR